MALASRNFQELLADVETEDIVLNHRGLSYYCAGRWHGPVASRECSPDSLENLSRKIAESAGTTLGFTNPSVDAFLNWNDAMYRAHVVRAPMSPMGTEITLRRLPDMNRFRLESFSDSEMLINELQVAVAEKKSILVAGATGSGKTSLLTALMAEMDAAQRVLILEDSPELPLPSALSSKLLCRTNRFGFTNGATWDLSHLVYESLRMRPDWMILGECRGAEARAISDALRTGHAVMTTLHAASAGGALERFAQLSGTSEEAPWDLALHVHQNPEGARKITEVKWISS